MSEIPPPLSPIMDAVKAFFAADNWAYEEIEASEEKQLSLAEYFTRANYGLLIGNFEMDFSDGEIRFKTSVDIEDSALMHKFIQNLV